ncbi:MAG: hypothetical protein Q8N65_02020 [bacterium]|nr:hypothetical protein [bacterium]
MAQTISYSQKLSSELENIKTEVQLLRSFLISLGGEDREGRYNPKFVKEILESAKEISVRSFKNSRAFLKEIG